MIEEYFRTKNLLKTPCVGIHYEQKITPDLIWCISHVILNLTKNDAEKIFTDTDIRESDIFNALMRDYFSKAPQENAENEYNKVSSYQLGLLSFAGILEQIPGNPKKYKINKIEILEYIAINDFNASEFLCGYTEKFIIDNGLSQVFENYKQNPNQDNYQRIKEAYWNWAKTNTAIRGDDRKHTYRVFNKMFNVFCYHNRLPGEDRANIISGPCPYSFLIYNRKNFRDRDMPVGMTRQEYHEQILLDIDSEGVVEVLLQKAKNVIKAKYNNDSEIKDPSFGYAVGRNIHIHHILPRNSYPQFSLAKENLISLTTDQHLSFAHKTSTASIDHDFQIICLKTKLEEIKDSIRNNDNFYSLEEFIKMLNTCFSLSLSENSSLVVVEESLENI